MRLGFWRRRAAVALLALFAATGSSWAVFTKTQMDAIDTEPLFDSAYFLNLLSFAYPVQWQELWRSTAAAYRINAASLDCCGLLLQQELRFEHRLVHGLAFRYRLIQQDDKDLQDFHQWLELEQDLGMGFSGLIFGEPTFRKEDSDIGFGGAYRRARWSFVARHYFVDFNFNERGHTDQRFGTKPNTDQFSVEYGAGGRTVSGDLELDYPLRLDVPDRHLQFNYRRTTAQAKWREPLPGSWRGELSYSYQFQDKGNRFNPDPSARSLDTRRQTHRALLECDGPVGRRDRLEVGQVFLERAARTYDASASNAGIFYRRWEVQPYGRWRRTVKDWLETELAAFLSFGENRRRDADNPAGSSSSNVVESKFDTGVDFVFGAKGRIGVNATWRGNDPEHPWGGGNMRALFFF